LCAVSAMAPSAPGVSGRSAEAAATKALASAQASAKVAQAPAPAAADGTPAGCEAPTLFLVVLGGRLPQAQIELHDVRFVVGRTIDDTLPALRRQWFGARRGLHLDSWMAVRWVDGHRVELRNEPFAGEQRLWFVNVGGYDPQQLAEQHAFGLVVARSAQAAKAAALRRMLPGLEQRHKDDLHGVAEAAGALAAAADERVDDCLDVQQSLAGLTAVPAGSAAGRWAVHLIPDGGQQPQVPDWYGYRPI